MHRMFLLVALAGCAPIIQSASPDGVSVQYEAPGMSVEDTLSTAQTACGAHGKTAKLVSDIHAAPEYKISDNLGMRLAYYECVAPE